MVAACQTGETIRRLAQAYLTTQQLYPALDCLWRLGFLYVLQGLVEQNVSRRGIGLAEHLGKQTGTRLFELGRPSASVSTTASLTSCVNRNHHTCCDTACRNLLSRNAFSPRN